MLLEKVWVCEETTEIFFERSMQVEWFHINQTDGQRFEKIGPNPDPGLKEGFLTFVTLKILDRIRTNFDIHFGVFG